MWKQPSSGPNFKVMAFLTIGMQHFGCWLSVSKSELQEKVTVILLWEIALKFKYVRQHDSSKKKNEFYFSWYDFELHFDQGIDEWMYQS